MTVFEGLAAEAIEQCLNNLISAKEIINERKGFDDSHLFLIKHLLALKEQIAPFESSFTETQVNLDFSTMKAELRRVLTGGITQLFTPTAFAPQISTSTVDSLQKVARALTSAVESFVVNTTKTLIGDLVSFLVQVSSFEKVNEEAQLKSQAWAAPESFERVARDTVATLSEKVPRIVAELLVYIPPAQVGIIFNPIRDSILDSWEQFLLVRNRTYPEQNEGEDKNDDATDSAPVFLSLQEVQKILDDTLPLIDN